MLQVRTGIGIDMHLFEKKIKKKVYIDKDIKKNLACCNYITLGGIKIPHICGIRAHSDGDVLLHSISDALYGSIGQGNIGMHFSDTNVCLQNADSSIFLLHANSLLYKYGWIISNLDSSIVCDLPKIMPYSAIIANNIANLLDLDPDCVSIKATTTENLLFKCKKDGILVFSVCTVTKKVI